MRNGYVDVRDGQLHYWTAGQGPALICLHQASQNSREYVSLIPYLAQRRTILAFDLPGHGQSFDPPHEYAVPDFTAALIEALDALNVRQCAVLGHHTGGVLAMELAAALPGRVTRIIASGVSYRTAEETAQLNAERAERSFGVDREGHFLTKMWKVYAGLAGHGTPIETMVEPYLVNQAMRLRPFDAHHAVLSWNKTPTLGRLACPTLILQGELDDFVKGQDKLMAMMPTARRQEIPGVGAFPFRDRPEEVAQMIDRFLSE